MSRETSSSKLTVSTPTLRRSIVIAKPMGPVLDPFLAQLIPTSEAIITAKLRSAAWTYVETRWGGIEFSKGAYGATIFVVHFAHSNSKYSRLVLFEIPDPVVRFIRLANVLRQGEGIR